MERRFAELPFTQSWQAIQSHLDSLSYAMAISFLIGGADDPRPQFIFIYHGHLFSFVYSAPGTAYRSRQPTRSAQTLSSLQCLRTTLGCFHRD